MAEINDLVQDFWRTSNDGDVGASILAMRRLHDILRQCLVTSEVCFDVISVFANAVDDRIHRIWHTSIPGTVPPSQILTTESRYCFMGIERCLISRFLNPKNWVTCSDSYLVS
jgi:hypothetical protein